MSLTQVTSTDSFSQIISKLNQTIAYVSSLSPSSLEIISVATPANNDLLRYNTSTSFFENISIAGTTNQITVTHGTGTLTLAAPQNLHTAATPTFAGMNLTTAPLSLSSGGTGATSAVTARTAILPSQTSNNGKYLQTNGTDVSWQSVTVSPPGADTQIVFNDGGSLGADSQLFYTKSTGTMSCPYVGATSFTATTSVITPHVGATGSMVIQVGFDTTDALQFKGATGAVVLNINTVNDRVGVGVTSPGFKLDVSGDVNVSTGSTFKINGTTILSASVLNVGGSGQITGVLQTSAQPNVTSVGTLTSLTVNGVMGLTGTVTLTGNLTAASHILSAQTLAATGTTTAIDSAGDILIKSAKSLKLNNVANTYAYSIKSPSALGFNLSWTLPTSAGSNGYFLQTDGAGNLSWIAGATGAAPVGGVNTQVQFNDGGAISGATGFTYDKTNMDVNVGRNVIAGGSFIASSDIALKEDIMRIESPLEIIGKIEGKKYFRKDLHVKQYGVIAQDIQKILPELVHLNGDYLGVSYLQFIPILIEAVKELEKRINQ